MYYVKNTLFKYKLKIELNDKYEHKINIYTNV